MKIEKTKGTHSEKDEIILITSNSKEAISLEDFFKLTYSLAKNELNRIRIPIVREQIIFGERPFMFEEKVKEMFQKAKIKSKIEIEKERRKELVKNSSKEINNEIPKYLKEKGYVKSY